MKGRELIQYILENALENFEFPGFEKEEMKINHLKNTVGSDLLIDEDLKNSLDDEITEAIIILDRVSRQLQ